MNGCPDTSGLRHPPQPYQQPEAGDFRREVPEVSLVFNPEERSLVLPSLPSGRLQQNLHRSRSVPGRISDPALPPPPRYRTPPAALPPPRPSPTSAPPRPSPLTRPAGARLVDVSISYDDGREVARPAGRGTPPAQSADSAHRPQSAPAAQPWPEGGGGGGGSPGGWSAGSGGSAPPAAEPSCCGAELRAVLRLVADNGRQLAQLRGQVRQLLGRDTAASATATGRNVLLREAQTQTEGEARPATAAAGVNTSFGLTPRRDVGTDPPPPPPVVTRFAAAPEPTPVPARRDSGPPQPAPGRPSEVTASGGRENTAQVQQRRVQEWVDGAGWAGDEPELTLRGVVLPPVAEQPPSPEASLHVDMQEYQPSRDGSADGSGAEDEAEMERAKPDKTFFQNVMGQVNEILDGARCGEARSPTRPEPPPAHAEPPPPAPEEQERDPVRRATLQQLRAAGVSFAPSQPNDGSVFDYSCLPRAARPSAAVPCSSDLSLEMNTLAMKYVDSRQLLQRAGAVGGRPTPHPVEARLLGKENLAPARGRPTDMTMYGISDSNMSFSTRKYMEKFNLQS